MLYIPEKLQKPSHRKLCIKLRGQKHMNCWTDLKLYFSDITFEDMKNKEFIQEFKEHNLTDVADANQLADFSKGIKTGYLWKKRKTSNGNYRGMMII